jgi:hypothetical protein
MQPHGKLRSFLFYGLFGGAILLLLPLAYVTAHYWVNAGSPAELPFHDSFAAGDFHAWGGFGMQQLCCDHSARIGDAPYRPGERAAEFVLNRSDPEMKGNHRAELRLHAAEWGRRYDYSMRILVPKEWVTDPLPVTIVQWHNVPDLWRGEFALPSVLCIDIRGNEWVVKLNWGTGQRWFNRNSDIHSITLWHGPLDRARWTSWTFRIKWSYGDEGVVEAWKDDRLIARHLGPDAYADVLAPYLKIGLYAWSWKGLAERSTLIDTRRIWFSDIYVAQSG